MHLQAPALPLRTARLELRSFSADDFAAYAAYHALPEVYRYLYTATPTAIDLEQRFLKVLQAPFRDDGDVFRLAVIARDDVVAVLGQVSLKLASRSALQAEVGYIFNPAFSGKGYATEAVAKMIDVGFSAFGFHRIFARLDTENVGSMGVVERLGLRREAHLKENDRFNGRWSDEYIYAILASEWSNSPGAYR